MQSGMFQLNLNDFTKGAVTAVLTGVITALATIAGSADFDVFTTDWAHVLNATINVTVLSFLGYLSKNLLTDKDARFLGAI